MTTPPGALRRARSVLLLVLAVEVGVLAISGVALYFLYRPSAAAGWTEIVGAAEGWDIRLGAAVRAVHQLAAWLAVPTAVAACAVLALRPAGVRRWVRPVVGAGIAVTALLASFTGFLLSFDQLGLWAVKVGTDLRGYPPLFGSTVRFVLIDGVEVSPGTVLRWLFVHALVLGPLLAGLLAFAWRGNRAEAPVEEAVAPS